MTRFFAPSLCFVALAALPAGGQSLTVDEIRKVIEQAAAEAARAGLRAHVAVADPDGRTLAVFSMDGAPAASRVQGGGRGGFESRDLPGPLIAATKAATGALLSSGGNAFSTRTAGFIVQEHFPPGISFTPGGPLLGVQFSSLACGGVVTPGLPVGLAADPGGVPLYKGGRLVGGLGVEGDGVYGFDAEPARADDSREEQAATAGAAGFAAPASIRADNILADGIRLAYSDAEEASPASGVAAGRYVQEPVAPPASTFVPITIGGVALEQDPRHAIRAGSALTAAEVERVIAQAAAQAARTRAAIRQPLGSAAQVNLAVVDVDGAVLGTARNVDAPGFGVDVAVQKARTAAFFSGATAGEELRRAGLAEYVTGEFPLDGSVAYTTRAIGFLAQPFFPPGIDGAAPGPLALGSDEWSPFSTGLQTEIVMTGILEGASGGCHPGLPKLANGITVFPGGVPLYKDGRLVGAIGVSGDGVDQDDLIASAGSAGFEAPEARRSDRLVLRGVRLPWVKYPRHPEL